MSTSIDIGTAEVKLIEQHKKTRVLFNGGTGGYLDRRNLESVAKLIENYKDKLNMDISNSKYVTLGLNWE